MSGCQLPSHVVIVILRLTILSLGTTLTLFCAMLQTAYEGGHHSHYSHSTHSHEGPARSPRAADKLVREIQEAIALLGGVAGGAASGAAAAGSFHRGGGRSGLADLGFPTFEPQDLAAPGGGAAAHLWNFGPGERAGDPRSSYLMMGGSRGAGGGGPPSPPLNLQGFLRSSGMGEHVGGNTPILEDFSYPLVSSPALLGALAADAMELPQRLSSLETPGGAILCFHCEILPAQRMRQCCLLCCSFATPLRTQVQRHVREAIIRVGSTACRSQAFSSTRFLTVMQMGACSYENATNWHDITT